MTTGRINQVTIVRRGWPPEALQRREKLVTDLAPESATVQRPRQGLSHWNRLPPLPSKFSKALVRYTRPLQAAAGGTYRPQKETGATPLQGNGGAGISRC